MVGSRAQRDCTRKSKPIYKTKHYGKYVVPHWTQNVWLNKDYYYKTKWGFSSWCVD